MQIYLFSQNCISLQHFTERNWKNCFDIVVRKTTIQGLVYFLKYYFFWVSYFLFFKILFLLYHFPFSKFCSVKEIWGVFRHGMIMDVATAAYLCVLPGVILLFLPYLKAKIIFQIIKWYSVFILVIFTFFGLLDLVLYAEWGTRLDNQIIPALRNPGGMIASVNWWQLLAFIFLIISIIILFSRLFTFIFPLKKLTTTQPKWYFTPVMLILTASLIIPMRGGVSIAPLNLSHVYFSNNLFANHAAYNPWWSFLYAVTHIDEKIKDIDFMTDKEAQDIIHPFYASDTTSSIPILLKSKDGNPINVILIILESFSNKLIEPLNGIPNLTPNFNALSKEGILFSSFYATGNRSDKGLASLLASYPAVIGSYSIVYYPDKLTHLNYLSSQFKQHQYVTSFYYGGNIHFYNTKSLLLYAEMDNIVSDNNFDRAMSVQKWGVPDTYLYAKVQEDIHHLKEPFFTTIYTISSHPPYDIPPFKKHENKYLNAVAYADSCLGHFINQIKKNPIWERTLVIITSDHGSLEPFKTSIEEPASYQIPMLWIGGVVDSAFTHSTIGMQTDLFATLMQQMGWKLPYSTYFSKNMFGKNGFAFYFNSKGYGFVSEDVTFFQNIETKQMNYFYHLDSFLLANEKKQDSLLSFPKAFVQYLHNDFNK